MRTSRRTPLAAVLVALTALVLVAGACGSDGDPDSSEPTTPPEESTPPETTEEVDADEFAAQLGAFCDQADVTATQAGDDLDAALEDLAAADDAGDQVAYSVALDEATVAVETVLGVFADFDEQLQSLAVPADLQTYLDDYVAIKDEQEQLTQELLDAIVNDDGSAFTEVTDELQSRDAEFDAATTDAAVGLGAPACVPDGN